MAPKAKASTSTKAKASQQQHSAVVDQQQPPNWPLLTPLPPSEDLSFDTLLSDQILTISNFWTSTLCRSYVNFLKTLPLTTTPGKPKRGEAVRVNDRFQVQDAAFAERLWSQTGLREMVTKPVIDGVELDEAAARRLWGGHVLGLNENVRVYRYSKGQFFDQHYDDSNNVFFQSPDSGSAATPAKTTWTLLLYLSSPATGCEGGQTVFYPDPPSRREAAPPPVIAELDVGMLLLHRHGKDCLLHEGREVTAGDKWVIRSDLCVQR